MFKHAVVAVMVCAAPMLATAYEPDDALLTDYHGLTKALRANGVEPVAMNWRIIESMCLGLKTEKNPAAYNRCRFETALNQASFADDRAACREDANRNKGAAIVAVAGDNALVSQQNVNVTPSYSECMRSLGWRSPNNWQRGRVTPEE